MRLLGVGLGLMMAGCATLVEGTTQEIFVSLTPEVARCDAYRVYAWERYQGVPRGGIPDDNLVLMGSYSPDTRSIKVGKSRRDLLIRCSAQGYRDKEVRLVSDASGWGIVGALTLDFGLIDYSTGALNKYADSVQIVLEPDDGSIPAQPVRPRPTF